MEYIAHRAGNSAATLRAAERRVEVVEVDIHLGSSSKVEVRHGKRLWLTPRLWEKWYLLPPETPVPLLDDILEAAQPTTTLWLDLKGPNPRLARLVAVAVGQRRPLVVSTKAWWLLGRFTRLHGVRTFRSAGNRFELALLILLQRGSKVDGAVVHRRLLSDAVIRRLLRRGELFTWAVEDVETVARMKRLGVTGVILDDLELVPKQ